ncbi:MAG: tetratricopeptide repeat protein [Acidobacteriota bacterium]
MDRVERKQLKQDEFVETTRTLVHRIEDNPKPWLYGAVGVVAVVAVSLVVNWLISGQSTKASDLLTRGQAAMVAPVGGEAPRPNDPYRPVFSSEAERAKAAIDRLNEASGSGVLGESARYLHGVALLESGDAAGAVRELETAASSLGSDVSLGPIVRAALAGAYSANNQHDKALEVYTTLAADTNGWYPRDLALAGKARAQEAKGQKADAKGTWEQLIDLFPQSSLVTDARSAVERLK